jgi:xylulokinase
MGTKAAVVDADGTLLGEAFEEVALHHPRPGLVEQDLSDIERSAHATLRRAVAASGRARDIAGVALSGQMSGIGTIDGSFAPVAPFDSWLDTRCAPYVAAMAEDAERVTALSGCPPTYSHGPKILWLRDERPDQYARVARFVVPGAFVAGRLCGLPADRAFIDRTYLHFSNLSDTAASSWSDELLGAFGIDRAVLPRVVDPLDVVGEVTPAAAEATGIPAGVPVAAGAGDQTAAALGAGVTRPGEAFDSAGTASVFAMCTDAFTPDVARRTLLASHGVIAGTFITLAFINGGGLALRWFRDEIARLGGDDAYARLDALAAAVEPGAGGLLWFPHLQGRVLPPQPHARGAWVGLTAGHTHGHLFRALLEGIAYEYAAWADLGVRASASEPAGGDLTGVRASASEPAGRAGAVLTQARALGGGAASALWNQIKADVLGIDWVPMRRQECGVLGDALIAAAATGQVGDLATTAKQWQRTAEPVRPDPARTRHYAGLRAAYDELGARLLPIMDRLADTSRQDAPERAIAPATAPDATGGETPCA